MSDIAQNLETILKQLGKTKLVAVSKFKTQEQIIEAYEAGQRDFGENKVQELLTKSQALETRCSDIRWHFIGNLQSNKMNQLLRVPNLFAIHSIDSLKLAKKLINKSYSAKLRIFLQVNTSGEQEKSGFVHKNELVEVAHLFKNSDLYQLEGLMTIGPIRTQNFEKDTKACFAQLVDLKNLIDPTLKLSMGMSADYHWAVELGSDWVRIGSAIFGART